MSLIWSTSLRLLSRGSWVLIHPQFRYLNKLTQGGMVAKLVQKVKSPSVKYYKEDFKASDGKTVHQHVVQAGDQILRQPSLPVNPKDISNPQIQTLVKRLKKMMKQFDGLGMSACQIGVPVQISAVQVTPEQLKIWPAELLSEQNVEVVPLTVMINPEVKIRDKTQVTFREGCCSFLGMTAHVPRYKEISVSYLNENGEQVNDWIVRDWTARIVQHEMDHLKGSLFTDFMKRDSLEFGYWKTVNEKGGDFKIWFLGKKSIFDKCKDLVTFQS